MTGEPSSDNVLAPGGEPPAADRARRISRNVTANWSGQFILIITGFLVPHFVYREVGREQLGVWDFGWSLLAHVSLLSAGLVSVLNHYVARYRGKGDPRSMNEIVSACLLVMLSVAVLMALVTAGLAFWIRPIFGASLGTQLDLARSVTFFLGLSGAVNVIGSAGGGIISGHERYVALNILEIGCHLLSVLAILVLLPAGYGLTSIAAATLGSETLYAVLTWMVARRICPTLHCSPRLVRRETLGAVVSFAGRSLLGRVSRAVLYQTTGVLIVAFLGASAMAAYARCTALMRQTTKVVEQFARVFTPMTSFEAARGSTGALRGLNIAAVRYSLLISLPILAVLATHGDAILAIWLGPTFDGGSLLAVLAIGHIGVCASAGSYAVLVGVGRHGLAAASSLAAALGSLGCAWGLLATGHGLFSVGSAMAIVLLLSQGILIPLLTCPVTQTPISQYLRRAILFPLVAVAPFVAALLLERVVLPPTLRLIPFLARLAAAGLVLAVVYLRWVAPPAFRRSLLARFGRILPGTVAPEAGSPGSVLPNEPANVSDAGVR